MKKETTSTKKTTSKRATTDNSNTTGAAKPATKRKATAKKTAKRAVAAKKTRPTTAKNSATTTAKKRARKTATATAKTTATTAAKTTAKSTAKTTAKKKARKTAKKIAKRATGTRAKSTAKSRPSTRRSGAAAKKTAVGNKKKKTGRRAAVVADAVPARRAIYIDVENTSSQKALFDVLDSLKIDRRTQRVELAAVGNWRAIGQQVGRDLAAMGAQLIHSAPARGVRDWSDLWIAVAAGLWIGRASPGDVLEIISNDKAFDAVGDAAAAAGVDYHRVAHRRGSAPAADAAAAKPAAKKRRSRGGRRRNRPTTSTAPATQTKAPAETPVRARTAATDPRDDPHGASSDQIFALVQQLAEGRPSPWVNLDVLEDALKREGFTRPPNSPRLVTRLRRLKDFEIDSHGRVRIAG